MSSKHSRNVASLKDVVADGARMAAAAAAQAERESLVPVPFSLTREAERVLDASPPAARAL